MKTVIKLKDGTVEEFDGAPSVNPETLDVVIIDEESLVLSRDYIFDEIESVTFTP